MKEYELYIMQGKTREGTPVLKYSLAVGGMPATLESGLTEGGCELVTQAPYQVIVKKGREIRVQEEKERVTPVSEALLQILCTIEGKLKPKEEMVTSIVVRMPPFKRMEWICQEAILEEREKLEWLVKKYRPGGFLSTR